MKTIEESVVYALDGTDVEIFPFIPFILQDLWELGSSCDNIISLINKHTYNFKELEILDLGCGKGAVSINIAKNLSCKCYGIDAVEKFIEFCNSKAIEYNVSELCYFKKADIREDNYFNKQFDIIILASIGPIFGDYSAMFNHISPYLKPDGLVIIDDGYLEDDKQTSHHIAIKKSELINQAIKANFILLDEIQSFADEQKFQDEFILNSVIARCMELIETYPSKRELFQSYINTQIQETEALETIIKCSTMAFKKSN